jgi:hypothetical protein
MSKFSPSLQKDINFIFQHLNEYPADVLAQILTPHKKELLQIAMEEVQENVS